MRWEGPDRAVLLTGRLAPPACRAVQLAADCADFSVRVGDLVQAPEGGWGRVVLVFSPRVVIARPPRWHDHLWLWLPRLIDWAILGPQRRDRR